MLGCRALFAVLGAASLLLTGTGRAADTPPAKRPARPAPSGAAPVATPPEMALPATGPRLVTLAGTIVDPSDKPCPGACVFLTTNPRLVAVTDAHGVFQLQVPAAATLHLQAEYVGLGSTRFDADGQYPQAVRIVLGH